MCGCHSILKCCVMCSGVKLSMRSFVLFLQGWGEFYSHVISLGGDLLSGKIFVGELKILMRDKNFQIWGNEKK